MPEAEEDEPKAASLEVEKEEITEGVTGTPEIIEADWSDFFDGLNGAADRFGGPFDQHKK